MLLGHCKLLPSPLCKSEALKGLFLVHGDHVLPLAMLVPLDKVSLALCPDEPEAAMQVFSCFLNSKMFGDLLVLLLLLIFSLARSH